MPLMSYIPCAQTTLPLETDSYTESTYELKTILLCPVTPSLGKMSLSLFFISLERPQSGLLRAFSSSGWMDPAFSACHQRSVSVLWVSSWTCSGLTPAGPHHSSDEELDTKFQVVSQQSRGVKSPPLPCWPWWPCCFRCSPGHHWLSGLLVHITGSCPASHSSVTLSPSP